ncbi:zinc finger BED domain-containing protein 1-like [Xiphophorus hellerii]|uniref:zinc finger BED domain-containing protein 1-like n=1 Tax=Xiphophorus hellerii TaxID=8084 RepID=UPI0013B3A867|nr:zinc finger BED domain-containing protein 1-like [Xiphophorus hellerii]
MELVSKPNATAAVWEYFGFKPNDRGEPLNLCEPVCRICHKIVATKGSNTTNLYVHLKHNHPVKFFQLRRKSTTGGPSSSSSSRQSTVNETFHRQEAYKKDGAKWCALTDSVVRLIAKEMLPFNIVEKPAFRKMLQTFDRRYEIPGKTYISQTAIPQLYSSIKEDILKEIKDISFYSATSDMWSSSNMTPYMSLTIHYIAADWTLHSKCLETRYVPDNHTANTLGENLKSALADWGLDEDKLVCITTDNGPNIVAAIRNLGWPWLNCFGHNLHLAVSHGLDSDKERTARAIGLCKSLVNTFNLSFFKKRDLRKAQNEANLPQHNLILDVVTRWGTKQKMIERVLEQLPAIRRVLVQDRKHSHLTPTWQDVAVLESINAALKPLADFTDVLSGETYVTVSSVKPVLELIKGDLLSPGPDDSTMTASIKQNVCKILTEKYSSPGIQNLLIKATILDPRYRGSMEEAGSLDDVKHQLVQELLDLKGPEVREEGASGEGSSQAAGGNKHESTADPPTKKKRLSDLLQNRRAELTVQTQATYPKREQADAELTKFLQEDAIDASCDPLMWWCDNQRRYPLMANLAKKYMCICATSTSSERMFSTAGNIATPERSCLKPHKLNMLVFLARNL